MPCGPRTAPRLATANDMHRLPGDGPRAAAPAADVRRVTLLRRLSLGRRLACAFAVVLLLLLGVLGVGLDTASAQSRAAAQLANADRLLAAAGQVKFRSADFNGWQTAYAFDVLRGAPDATSDGAPSRAAFLSSAAAFQRELATATALASAVPQAAQAAASAASGFDSFRQTDAEVIAGYRSGRPTDVQRASALVLGQ